MNLPYSELLTPELIWNIEQNKPSLIVGDFEALGIDPETTHSILLARGVYKWLSVRRLLIKTKDAWKETIKDTLAKLREAKIPNNAYQIGYLRGYLKAKEECRADIRKLCHSERWQAPDFDRNANKFLDGLIQKRHVHKIIEEVMI